MNRLLITTIIFSFIISLAGCSKSYYISYVVQPVTFFESKKADSPHITIPKGEYILFFDKPQKIREAYYNGLTGYIYNSTYYNLTEKKIRLEELHSNELSTLLPPQPEEDSSNSQQKPSFRKY